MAKRFWALLLLLLKLYMLVLVDMSRLGAVMLMVELLMLMVGMLLTADRSRGILGLESGGDTREVGTVEEEDEDMMAWLSKSLGRELIVLLMLMVGMLKVELLTAERSRGGGDTREAGTGEEDGEVDIRA